MSKCKHEKTITLKSFRKNKKHGKPFIYYPPKKIVIMCSECGEKIHTMKPDPNNYKNENKTERQEKS